MKIVITSDWHLDALTDGVPRFDEVEAAIDGSVETALSEQAALYVVLGDITDPDGWCSIQAMAKAIQVASKLKRAGIDTVWLAGNHDVVEDGVGTTTLTPLVATGLPYYVFEEPHAITFERGKKSLTIVGLPFTARAREYNPEGFIKNLPKPSNTTIVIGHLNIEGITSGSESAEMARGRDIFWPLAVLEKKLSSATLIAGHYHKAQTFKRVNVVGSLARLRHDEEDHKPGFMVLEV